MVSSSFRIEKWMSGLNILINRIPLLRPTRAIFWIVFVLVFLLSGLLSMLDIIPYRMGVVSFLVLPLFLIHKIRWDRVLISYALLALVVAFSALLNNSSPTELFLFMRTLIFSYLVYFLVNVSISEKNVAWVIRLCVWIGVIQFPIVFLQQMLFERLPAWLLDGVSKTDFDFGTFNFKGDAPMAFFLILIVIFLLFNRQRRYIIKHRFFVVVWLTLTVLFMNSQVNKIIIMGVWLVYIFYRLNPKRILYFCATLAIVLGLMAATGILQPIVQELRYSITTNINTQKTTTFQSGGYGRGAAFAYYLSQDIKWFGDGPSKYYDPVTRGYVLGNTGHILTFYAEVGLLGTVLSYITFYFMQRSKRPWLSLSIIDILSIGAIIALSIVIPVMNDISVVLAYAIFSKQYLIPLQKPSNQMAVVKAT